MSAATPAVTALGADAAQAAVTAAAKALGLPTVREEAARYATAAAKARLTHLAFLAEVLSAECDDREHRRRQRRINEAKFPATNACPTSTPPACPTCPQRPWPTWAAVPGSRPGNRWCCSATPEPARRICSSPWAWPRPSRVTGSATSPPRPWSTN